MFSLGEKTSVGLPDAPAVEGITLPTMGRSPRVLPFEDSPRLVSSVGADDFSRAPFSGMSRSVKVKVWVAKDSSVLIPMVTAGGLL